jgi:hypothetical protein
MLAIGLCAGVFSLGLAGCGDDDDDDNDNDNDDGATDADTDADADADTDADADAWCDEACNHSFDCEDELVEAYGQDGFDEIFGDSVEGCLEWCAVDFDELPAECLPCFLEAIACDDIMACAAEHCDMGNGQYACETVLAASFEMMNEDCGFDIGDPATEAAVQCAEACDTEAASISADDIQACLEEIASLTCEELADPDLVTIDCAWLVDDLECMWE